MKKFLLSLALVLLSGAAVAQSTIDLTFDRNNSAAGTDAAVTVTGDITGVTSTVSCNLNWKTFGANSETFPNASILCPDKNTKDMTPGNEGVITFTLAGFSSAYEITKVTFTSVALNGAGQFQGDNANAQHIDFILLDQNDNEIAKTENKAIKVNSNGGDSVVVDFNLNPESRIKVTTDGTNTLKLKLVNNYDARGCFYGLYKISLTAEPIVEIVEKAFYHPSGKNLTAEELMAKTQPTYIAIKGLAIKNHEYWNYVSGEANTSTEYFKQNAIFVWEPVTNGIAESYYLRKIGNGYMQASNPGTYAETTEDAAVFTAVKPVEVTSGANGVGYFNHDANSVGYIQNAGGADYIVRFVTNGKWLNIGDRLTKDQAPAFNNGYGTFTVYQICELDGFDETLNITIKNSGEEDYATFYSNAPTRMPGGVTAYTITDETINNDYITLNGIAGGSVIPANTGVILKTAVGEDVNIAVTVVGEDEAPLTTNLLKGSVDNQEINEEAYVLGNKEGVGLYKAQMTNGSWLNNAGKAYLPVSSVATSARLLRFNFGGNATAIESVKSELDPNAPIYDLSGRRVKVATKGIYIQNGKKFMVK